MRMMPAGFFQPLLEGARARLSVCEGSHAGALLEEIGEGALVAEVEVGGNLANGHVGM